MGGGGCPEGRGRSADLAVVMTEYGILRFVMLVFSFQRV